MGRGIKYHLDAEWLRQKYWVERLNAHNIALLSGASKSTVLYRMQQYNIPRRSSNKVHFIINAEWLRQKYWDEGLSMDKIARLAGVCQGTIWNRMKKYGIPRRSISESERGEKHPNWGKRGKDVPGWKGGRRKRPDGYIQIRKPDHPRAVKGYVNEHRLVVEQALGRYLKPSEFVHHINGIKDDNRLENLRLVTHHNEAICPNCGWPFDNIQVYVDRQQVGVGGHE